MSNQPINLERYSTGNKLRLELDDEMTNDPYQRTAEVIKQVEDAVVVELDEGIPVDGNKTVDTVELTHTEQIDSEFPLVKSGVTVYRTAVVEAELVAQ